MEKRVIVKKNKPKTNRQLKLPHFLDLREGSESVRSVQDITIAPPTFPPSQTAAETRVIICMTPPPLFHLGFKRRRSSQE